MFRIVRKMERLFFYLPFVIAAVFLGLSFRFRCRDCKRSLLFDWIASRQGYCQSCLLKDRETMDRYYLKPNPFVHHRVIPQIGDGLVLDAGCGAGYATEMMLEGTGRKCVGIDVSSQGVMNASSKCSEAEFARADVTHLPFKSDVFDWLVSVEVLEHVADIDKAVQEYYRVLKHDGKLIVTIPNGRGITAKDDLGHVHFLSLGQFTNLLKRGGFEIHKSETFGVEFPVLSYLAKALSAASGKQLPLANPISLHVPEMLSTNFLVSAGKPITSSVVGGR